MGILRVVTIAPVYHEGNDDFAGWGTQSGVGESSGRAYRVYRSSALYHRSSLVKAVGIRQNRAKTLGRVLFRLPALFYRPGSRVKEAPS